MFVKKLAMDRRMFLRASGAALALPLLDAMSPALSAATARVPRIGFLYIPNGVNPNTWSPEGQGKQFEFSSVMESLQPFKQQVNVFTNIAHHCADRRNDGAGDHSRATGAFLSGCHAKRTQGDDLQTGHHRRSDRGKIIARQGHPAAVPGNVAGGSEHRSALRRGLHLRLQQHPFRGVRRPRRYQPKTIPGWSLSVSLAKRATPRSGPSA